MRHRRRRAAALGAAVVAFAVGITLAGFALFGGGDDNSAAPSPSAAGAQPSTTTTSPIPAATPATSGAETPSSSSTTTTSTTAPLPTASAQTYAVGTRSFTFVDSTRATSANGSFAGAPNRTLPTQVWYPAEGTPGDDAQPDAPPDRKHGRYPLVLFAHGYDVTPTFYLPLLERWAAAGYVVAAPTYPILSGNSGGASHVDYEQTFADTSFVLTQMLSLGANDALAGMIDPNRVAATGHSDGEVIAFGVGFLTCCRDVRVKSVIAMAGDLDNANNPTLRNTGTPILHIMELNDEYDPYQHSIAWDRENLTSPRWLVSLNSSHVPPYTQPGDPAFELVSRISLAFLDGTLKGHPERLDDITSAVAAAPDVGAVER